MEGKVLDEGRYCFIWTVAKGTKRFCQIKANQASV